MLLGDRVWPAEAQFSKGTWTEELMAAGVDSRETKTPRGTGVCWPFDRHSWVSSAWKKTVSPSSPHQQTHPVKFSENLPSRSLFPLHILTVLEPVPRVINKTANQTITLAIIFFVIDLLHQTVNTLRAATMCTLFVCLFARISLCNSALVDSLAW